MDDISTECQVNQKMALMLAYDCLESLSNSDNSENKSIFLYTTGGKKITLQDALEAVKNCACAI